MTPKRTAAQECRELWQPMESFSYVADDGSERVMRVGQIVEGDHVAYRLHRHFFTEVVAIGDEVFEVTEH
jgi:hypothetical protein